MKKEVTTHIAIDNTLSRMVEFKKIFKFWYFFLHYYIILTYAKFYYHLFFNNVTIFHIV